MKESKSKSKNWRKVTTIVNIDLNEIKNNQNKPKPATFKLDSVNGVNGSTDPPSAIDPIKSHKQLPSDESVIKITDNYKERLFNYKSFKAADKEKNVGKKSLNITPVISNSSWVKKQETVVPKKVEEIKIDLSQENTEQVKLKGNHSEDEMIQKLSQEQPATMIDGLFDENNHIASKLSDDDELSMENHSNINKEKNNRSPFLKKKRNVLTKSSAYNSFLKLKKDISKKSYLAKRLNTNYMKELEEDKGLDYDLDYKSLKSGDVEDDEFYGLKPKSKEGFISAKFAKDKRKSHRGFICDICKNVRLV